MAKFTKMTDPITEQFEANGGQTVEKMGDSVVSGFKKIEDSVVGGFTKMADKFVDQFLTHDGESVEDAKKRLTGEPSVCEAADEAETEKHC